MAGSLLENYYTYNMYFAPFRITSMLMFVMGGAEINFIYANINLCYQNYNF